MTSALLQNCYELYNTIANPAASRAHPKAGLPTFPVIVTVWLCLNGFMENPCF
jgi:hypothetical protein